MSTQEEQSTTGPGQQEPYPQVEVIPAIQTDPEQRNVTRTVPLPEPDPSLPSQDQEIAK